MLRCPYCGQPVWSTDDGARCTDPDYASGFTPRDRSCGAAWDSVGIREQPPTRWHVRRESRPWVDGGHVPLPAVWVARGPDGSVEFVTDNHRGAMLIADARAHGRPDPHLDDE